MKVLHISGKLLQEVINHCRRELPNEACGLLAGRDGHVKAVLALPNVSPQPRRNYLVETCAQKQAFERIENSGWELTGIYHSHPNGKAVPSESDIRQAFYPEAGYVIVGLGGNRPDIKAYHMRRDKGTCVRIHVEVDKGKTQKLGRFFGPVVSSYWRGMG